MIDFEARAKVTARHVLTLGEEGAASVILAELRLLAADMLEEAAQESDETAALLAAEAVLNPDHEAAFSAAVKALNESAESIRSRAKEIMKPCTQ